MFKKASPVTENQIKTSSASIHTCVKHLEKVCIRQMMASVQREVVQPRANLQALTRQQRSDWLNQLNYVGFRAQELRDVFISPDLFLVRPCQRFQLCPPSFTTAAISLFALMGHFCMHACMHACSERNTLHCSSAALCIKYPFNFPLNLSNQLKMHLLVLAQTYEDGENPC